MKNSTCFILQLSVIFSRIFTYFLKEIHLDFFIFAWCLCTLFNSLLSLVVSKNSYWIYWVILDGFSGGNVWYSTGNHTGHCNEIRSRRMYICLKANAPFAVPQGLLSALSCTVFLFSHMKSSTEASVECHWGPHTAWNFEKLCFLHWNKKTTR